MRTIVTRVSKAKGRRDYGVAARGRAAKPDPGGGVPIARRDFFRSWVDCYPYKPHVGAFVGADVSDMFDVAYHVRYRPVSSRNRRYWDRVARCAGYAKSRSLRR